MRIRTIGKNTAVRIETVKGLPNRIKVVYQTHIHMYQVMIIYKKRLSKKH